jgi:glutamate formiminotransferase/glutamate formiminotransferase/formiminotetrahydrofolate cyclodeaminase
VTIDALPLLAVPNVSEGRGRATLEAVRGAFAGAARLLDVHADPDHHRAVFTLAGRPGELAQAVLAGAREAVARIDLSSERGVHPHVGAVDVAPIVYLNEALRGAACAEALVTAELIASELEVPVFLYGVLAGGRTRAELRRGGRDGLAARLAAGELRPDFGPGQLHPSAGAMLVAARPPLVAFNVELAVPADLALARAIAAELRESAAGGLPGLRAIGLELASRAGAPQVSMNVEDPGRLALAAVVEEIGRRAPIACAEIVGLVQAAALEGFPEDVELRGFDPARQIIENALRLVT